VQQLRALAQLDLARRGQRDSSAGNGTPGSSSSASAEAHVTATAAVLRMVDRY
jgi:hypothetical protein